MARLVVYEVADVDSDAATTPPRPSPARGASRPLSSGVQAAGASLPSTAPQTRGLGRSCRVKGPSPRRFAPAGRTNPLTRHPLVGIGCVQRSWPGLRIAQAECSVEARQ